MSRDTLETVRGSIDAANELARGGADNVDEFWHDDITWRAIEGAPDDVGEMRGRAAIRRYGQEWIEMFDDIKLVPLQLRELDDDRAIAELELSGKAKLSGAETSFRYGVLYTIREGKIVRGKEYPTFEEALEAARCGSSAT